ncbi:hypothetical protein [Bacillus cereus group sp. TH150LC]|uniref:hypothetical protein n=1 Tax=Bacillus cereus group sp. TH150LC TaxID=3018061 RepID=UPI0022E5B598|nr:hypothetical protein [Bacillus cereus group sp. TH150LC]MDA1657008.1 hypothetical protein [Bacillus cereus group sp. TH150LC]HDR4513819.1 hypothetical protein [Bacillus cereus]
MRQADLVKLINKKRQTKISQKSVKEKIDKIFNFIERQLRFNSQEFDRSELLLFGTCIKSMERKNFCKYTGAIFVSLILIYENEESLRKVIQGKIVDDNYLEDFITVFEEYMNEFIGIISHSDKDKNKLNLTLKENKILEKYDQDFPYFMYVSKDFLRKIFSSKNIINTKIKDEMNYTANLFEIADSFSEYRRYLFIKNLNKKINSLLKKEKFDLKEELRDAIITDNIDVMESIMAELSLYPEFVEDNGDIIRKLEELEDKLHSRYKLNSKEVFQIGVFKRNILKYERGKTEDMALELKGMMESGGKREILLFVKKINSAHDREIEKEKKDIREEYKETKELFLRAGRLKSIVEMHRILKQRIEYIHLTNNDKQLYNKIEELMIKALKEENIELLLKIDNILKYYKRFFM